MQNQGKTVILCNLKSKAPRYWGWPKMLNVLNKKPTDYNSNLESNIAIKSFILESMHLWQTVKIF